LYNIRGQEHIVPILSTCSPHPYIWMLSVVPIVLVELSN
jgi:hypothetical protein